MTPASDAARAEAQKMEGYQCIHDNNCGDIGGRQSWCVECIAETLTAFAATAVERAVAEERKACIADTCWMCRSGHKPEMTTDGWAHPQARGTYRLCPAAAIRARTQSEGGTSG